MNATSPSHFGLISLRIYHVPPFLPPIIPTRTQYTWKDLRPGSLILFQLDKQELPPEPHMPEGSESLERYQKFLPERYAGLVVGSFRRW